MLILTGRSGSGKSSLATALATAVPAHVIEVGQIVRARHAVERSSKALVDFADDQFRKLGPTCFVRQASTLLVPGVKNIVVGIRRPEEYAFLSNLDKNAQLVWIETSNGLCEARKAPVRSLSQHRRRALIEESWGLTILPTLADLVVDGSNRIAELTGEIVRWLTRKSSVPSDQQPPRPTPGAD